MFTHYKAFCVEKQVKNCCLPLREKCPYSELFWFIFSRIRTEYREILSISPYLVQMRQNTDQSNSEHGHFLLSVHYSQSKLEVQLSCVKLKLKKRHCHRRLKTPKHSVRVDLSCSDFSF